MCVFVFSERRWHNGDVVESVCDFFSRTIRLNIDYYHDHVVCADFGVVRCTLRFFPRKTRAQVDQNH